METPLSGATSLTVTAGKPGERHPMSVNCAHSGLVYGPLCELWGIFNILVLGPEGNSEVDGGFVANL